MKYIKYSVLLLLFAIFFIGFTQKISLRDIKFVSDKEIHFIVFLVYPFLTYFLLGNFKYKKYFVFFSFILLSFFIEIIQCYIPYRSYCLEDVKYAVLGCLFSTSLISYFK